MMNVISTETFDDSMTDTDNEIHVVNVQQNKQQHATQNTATSSISNSTPQQPTTTNDIKKPPNKKATLKTVKRNRSPNSSLDATTTNNTDIEEGYLYCINDDSSTYERNDYEEKIDWILASQSFLSFISNVETHATIDSTSGHKPLTFEISIGVEHKPTSPRTSFNFKAANWIKFKNILNDQLQLWNQSRTINTTVKIEEYNMLITNSLLEATQATIPKLKQAATSYTISDATRS
ncbi:unnamed protein product [Rotaria magnacalcarata]|nr:unnamed protein product [Rotaria magnacalcarata]CAF2131658.1 unnamed protein product [Rotaria magnacalcarata]CAF4468530.1 unnamed protein product [Rotaria magnacalcarata]CAF4520855.1 unnamed protein product [Rotaria magnacalcarata]